ncbi:hypothetical protein ACHQM5_008919 [Ranunculus cassubicifolius]
MEKKPHILVVPFPAQGHIAPLVKFSSLLVDHGIKVTFVNIKSMHEMIVSTVPDRKDEERENFIHFVSIPDELDLKDDNQGPRNPIDIMLKSVSFHVEELIMKVSESEDEKIDCVIADASVGRTLEVVERFGIKGVAFWPASCDIDNHGNPMKEEVIRLPLSMPAMSSVDLIWGFSNDPSLKEIMLTFIRDVNRAAKVAKWILCNSFYELEPASHNSIPNILSIGPLLATEKQGHPTGQLFQEDFSCLNWLDQQPLQSVIYVAFGSTTLLNQPFLWVFRTGLTGDLSTSFPDEFKETIAQHGKVVNWAPQQKVLAHPSVACFITHCGWNSTMEGVSMGVPLLCWPYVADQFHNQNYICKIWQVGLNFDKDENGIITRSEINRKVHELLGDGGIRSRANKLKGMAKISISEGGYSSKNLQDFLDKVKY